MTDHDALIKELEELHQYIGDDLYGKGEAIYQKLHASISVPGDAEREELAKWLISSIVKDPYVAALFQKHALDKFDKIAQLLRRPVESVVSDAAADVLAERRRQIEKEGWTPEHDDEHREGQMAHAAACYAFGPDEMLLNPQNGAPTSWPWDAEWWKPKDKRRNLVRAGALIFAEIERLDRKAALNVSQPWVK